MSGTPLQQALDWFASQDDTGGFKTAGVMLFPGWEVKNHAMHHTGRIDINHGACIKTSGASGDSRPCDGEQGGLVGFVMLVGMDEKQAAHWLMEKAGIITGQPITYTTRPRPESRPRAIEKLPAMPIDAMGAWNEGVDYLQDNTEFAEGLSSFRGWPLSLLNT